MAVQHVLWIYTPAEKWQSRLHPMHAKAPLYCFLFFDHVSPLRFFSPLYNALGVNRVSSLIDSWRRLSISWYPCPSHSCPFCTRPWILPSVDYYFPCFTVAVRRRWSFFTKVPAWKGFLSDIRGSQCSMSPLWTPLMLSNITWHRLRRRRCQKQLGLS